MAELIKQRSSKVMPAVLEPAGSKKIHVLINWEFETTDKPDWYNIPLWNIIS